jgi:subtilase family serine protease
VRTEKGTASNTLVNSLWQQGAAEGISIFVSSGDQGSAGCSHDNQSAPTPDTFGTQVNGYASSPGKPRKRVR